MRRIRIVIAALLVLTLVIGITFFIISFIGPKNAGLLVDTQPASIVYINNQQMGRTPYEETREAGEIVIKLVPESFEKPLAPYETKINLTSGVKTIVQRTFGKTEEESSGVIVSFEKEAQNSSSISVVSNPDAGEVRIDGQVVGFTPHKTSNVTVGEHTITVSAKDYLEKSLDIKTYLGFKLTAVFDLQKENVEEKQNGEVEEEKVEEEKFVLINDTPTGFLRVRQEPSTQAKEVGQVEPGEKYLLVDEDERTGWYKIEFNKSDQSIEGWISDDYVSVE